VQEQEAKANRTATTYNITRERNKKDIPVTLNESDPTIEDYYTDYDPLDKDAIDQQNYEKYVNSLSQEERELIEKNEHYYTLKLENKGGLVMPVILKFVYEDGTEEVKRIPAEIWRFNNTVSKSFILPKKAIDIILDPYLETADVDTSNNSMKPKSTPDRFELFKRKNGPRGSSRGENPMQRAKRAKAASKVTQP